MTERTDGNGAPPRAVLFDMDGTLVATRRLYVEAYARTVEPLLGRLLGDEEIMGLRPSSEQGFLEEIVGTRRLESCREAFYRHYACFHEALFEGVYRGVPELLESLRDRGIPLGVVTGKSRRAWEITGGHVSLGPFRTMVFDDDVPRPKPDPAGLELALARMGAEARETVYVGDSLSDLDAALAAGVRPAAALWPKREDEIETFRREAEGRGACLLPEPAEVPARLGFGRPV